MSIPISSWPVEPDARARFLVKAISPIHLSLLRMVADEAMRSGLPLYIVGGFVRDLLLDLPAVDLDLVVEGDATTLANALVAKYGGKVTLHYRFGTAQWFLPETISSIENSTLDLISSRTETYQHPAALPTVHLGRLIDDLRRRDFSINSLALRLDGKHFGELRDDLGGVDDLRHGLVRILHPHSFIDDPTRIFRAIRYAERYGFQISPETLELIPPARKWLRKLSAKRLRHELDLILDEDNAASMLMRLKELDVFTEIHPALTWNQSINSRVKKAMRVPAEDRLAFGWMLWLMHLSHHELELIESRLHFHASTREILFAVSVLYSTRDFLRNKKPSQCVALLEQYPLASIRAVYLATSRGAVRRSLFNYLETWRHVKPKTTGHTLKNLGLEPGPEYQKILRLIRDAWLDKVVSSDEEEISLLEKLIRRKSKNPYGT
jgi:tRNA nucleotidyltransferase (CCA-adding enzyme)